MARSCPVLISPRDKARLYIRLLGCLPDGQEAGVWGSVTGASLSEALEHHRCLDAVTAAESLAPAARSSNGVEPISLSGLIVDGLLQRGQVA
jgi:hypothetical protein